MKTTIVMSILASFMIPTLSYAKIEAEQWENACSINTIESYTEYVKEYREGAYRSNAIERVDGLIKSEIIKFCNGQTNPDYRDGKELPLFIVKKEFPMPSEKEREVQDASALYFRECHSSTQIKPIQQCYWGKKLKVMFIINPLDNGRFTATYIFVGAKGKTTSTEIEFTGKGYVVAYVNDQEYAVYTFSDG